MRMPFCSPRRPTAPHPARKVTPSRAELFKSEKSPKEKLMRDFHPPLKGKSNGPAKGDAA